jgi:hypothetical protein
MSSSTTAGVVPIIFLLGPPSRLLSAIVWVAAYDTIALHVGLDWAELNASPSAGTCHSRGVKIGGCSCVSGTHDFDKYASQFLLTLTTSSMILGTTRLHS